MNAMGDKAMTMNYEAERSELIVRRRRRIILDLIRQNHEKLQEDRYTDSDLWAMLLKIGVTVGRFQVITILQDLQVLDYVDFKTTIDDETGRRYLTEIVLTAAGLRFYTRRKSNDDVAFD
jgi:hypothetical protein